MRAARGALAVLEGELAASDDEEELSGGAEVVVRAKRGLEKGGQTRAEAALAGRLYGWWPPSRLVAHHLIFFVSSHGKAE